MDFEKMLNEEKIPVVIANEDGAIIKANEKFLETYSWEKEKLVNSLLTTIIPKKFRDAHNLGFSRFLVSEETSAANHEIILEVVHGDGNSQLAKHFITAGKVDGKWQFAASILPLDEK